MTAIILPERNTDESDTKLIRVCVMIFGLVLTTLFLGEGIIISYVVCFAIGILIVIARKKLVLRKNQIERLEMMGDVFLVYSYSKEVLKIPVNKVTKISKALYWYIDYSGSLTNRYVLRLSNTYYFGNELVLGYKFNDDKTPFDIELITTMMGRENFDSNKK